jgi:hypothetical protein
MYEVTLIDIQSGVERVSIPDIIEDGIITVNHSVMPYRFLITSSNSRIEFPMDKFIVKFGDNRQIPLPV